MKLLKRQPAADGMFTDLNVKGRHPISIRQGALFHFMVAVKPL